MHSSLCSNLYPIHRALPNLVTSQGNGPPPYYGMENKGLEQSIDANLQDDPSKLHYGQMNGYGYSAPPNGHIGNGGEPKGCQKL